MTVALRRGMVFLGLWFVLIGLDAGHLPFGLLAAAAASWASLGLWPAGARLSLMGAAGFLLRFLPQSVFAGVDVARHAFSPRIGLRPGFLSYPTAIPAGDARRAFCAVMSLQPGKLPVAGDGADGILVHCLDGNVSATGEIAADEAAFLKLSRRDGADG